MKALTCRQQQGAGQVCCSVVNSWAGTAWCEQVKLTNWAEADYKLAKSCQVAKLPSRLAALTAQSRRCASWLCTDFIMHERARVAGQTHARTLQLHVTRRLIGCLIRWLPAPRGNGVRGIVELWSAIPNPSLLCSVCVFISVFISFPLSLVSAARCQLTTLCSQLAICWFDWWPTPRDLPIANPTQSYSNSNSNNNNQTSCALLLGFANELT